VARPSQLPARSSHVMAKHRRPAAAAYGIPNRHRHMCYSMRGMSSRYAPGVTCHRLQSESIAWPQYRARRTACRPRALGSDQAKARPSAQSCLAEWPLPPQTGGPRRQSTSGDAAQHASRYAARGFCVGEAFDRAGHQHVGLRCRVSGRGLGIMPSLRNSAEACYVGAEPVVDVPIHSMVPAQVVFRLPAFSKRGRPLLQLEAIARAIRAGGDGGKARRCRASLQQRASGPCTAIQSRQNASGSAPPPPSPQAMRATGCNHQLPV
jgi:hypothetical protein